MPGLDCGFFGSLIGFFGGSVIGPMYDYCLETLEDPVGNSCPRQVGMGLQESMELNFLGNSLPLDSDLHLFGT